MLSGVGKSGVATGNTALDFMLAQPFNLGKTPILPRMKCPVSSLNRRLSGRPVHSEFSNFDGGGRAIESRPDEESNMNAIRYRQTRLAARPRPADCGPSQRTAVD